MLKSVFPKLNEFIKQLQSLPVSQLKRLDGILSDLGNYVYEIGEHISELRKEVKNFNSSQKKTKLPEIEALQKELNELADLIYDMEYASHYMNYNTP